MTKTKAKIIAIALTILLIFLTPIIVCAIFVDNKNVEYEEIVIDYDDNLTQDIKIAHLSDMHFPRIKVDIQKMIDRLKDIQPDFVAITGDFIDASAVFDDCKVKEFIDKIVEVAPVYYVNGNHEVANKDSEKLYDYLREKGVFVLQNQDALFTKGDLSVTIVGILDNDDYRANEYMEYGETDYRILLAHRPDVEKTWTYVSNSGSDSEYLWRVPNLVLSGHAHGGQFIINGKGLIAPNQGFFPKYYNGRYQLSQRTTMVVSRGLGNSIIPFRINNPPNIPIITIMF